MKAFKYIALIIVVVICFGFIFHRTSPINHNKNLNNQVDANEVFSKEISSKSIATQSDTSEKIGHKTTLGGSYTEYLSENMITGIIGALNVSDNPSDNLFIVNLDKQLSSNTSIWLEYELFGVQDYNSISHSINDNLATGGCMVKKSEKWSKQREEIRADVLKKGKNVIRFTAPTDNNFVYKVKNVSLIVQNNPNTSERRLVVNQPTTAYYYKTLGYIQGFVQGRGSEHAVITMNTKRARLINGVFEDVVTKPDNSKESWAVTVEARFEDGQVLQTTVHFDKPIEWDFYNGFDKFLHQTESFVKANKPFELNLQGASIKSDSCALASDAHISITALRDVDFPPLESGMINVTGGHSGYRFLPHATHFDREVQIVLPYDECKIPVGYDVKDIVTYYFDETKRHWIPVQRESVNLQAHTITSQTNHFTDFINTILKVPESPQSQAYVPTTISEIKAANPLEGCNVISAPVANNMGTANMNYPIVIPPGRNGMQPHLEIKYSSGTGSTWLGHGWDLSIPAISIETKWGVPRYDPAKETETYLFKGDQLLVTHDGVRDTVAFRAVPLPRNLSGAKSYSPRVEGTFDTIIRHGNTPKEYWWEVIERNGVVSYYGKSHSQDAVDNSMILKDQNDNIAYWGLSEVVDPYGNWIRYNYDKVYDAGVYNSALNGIQMYIRSINYTGYDIKDGKYNVYFSRVNKSDFKRPDITISGRYGFKEVSADLLKSISIVFTNVLSGQPDTIRQYYFSYRPGEFDNTLLCEMAEADQGEFLLDSQINDVYKFGRCPGLSPLGLIKVHSFDYFDDIKNTNGSKNLYGNSESITVPDNNILGNLFNYVKTTALSGTQENNHSIGGAVTVGIGLNPLKKTNTIGGNYHYRVSKSDGVASFIDLTGDGLPDLVYWKKDDGLYYRKHTIDDNGDHQFSDEMHRGNLKFQHQESKTNSYGLELQVLVLCASAEKSTINTTTSVFFSDVNGDGLPDIVDNGEVYFNSLDANGNPTFAKQQNTFITVSSGGCDYINYSGSVNDSTIKYNTSFDPPPIVNVEPNMDAVRVWVAPYFGIVTVDAPIKLIEESSVARQNSKAADGVRYRIQKNSQATELINGTIEGDDYDTHNIITQIEVSPGDRLYFRLQSKKNHSFDRVEWSPTIIYNGSPVLDANQLDIYKFNSGADFLVNGDQRFYAPVGGRVKIQGSFHLPILSETVRVKIVKNGSTVLLTRMSTGSAVVDDQFDFNAKLLEGDYLEFSVAANTNVDWHNIIFTPHVYYDSLPASYGTPDNPDGSHNFEYYPVINYSTFSTPVFPSIPVAISSYPSLQITHALGFSTSPQSGTIIFAVKGNGHIIAKRTLKVVGNVVQATTPMYVNTSYYSQLYFEYYTDSIALAKAIVSPQVHLVSSSPVYDAFSAAGVHTKVAVEVAKFGSLYRGWGQFTYNNQSTQESTAIIDESKLTLPSNIAPSSIPTIDTINGRSYNYLQNLIGGVYDPMKHEFIVMVPDNKNLQYCGFSDMTSINGNVQNNVRIINDDVLYDDSLVVSSNPNIPVKAVRKQTATTSTSFSLGAALSPGSLTASGSSGTTMLAMDYMDLNGDRYPDIVGSSYVQYSNSQGGLSPYVIDHSAGLVRSFENTSYAAGFAFAISSVHSKERSSANVKICYVETFGESSIM